MKIVLGSILGLVITLPAIGNAQVFNSYHPQQMRMAPPVMPYHMNRAPYANRWNPWVMPARAPIQAVKVRPMMHQPNPAGYGNYPVAHYQPKAQIPRYSAPSYASNSQWRNYRAGAKTPNRTYRQYASAPYRYRTSTSFPRSRIAAYRTARQAPVFQQRGWKPVSRMGIINQAQAQHRTQKSNQYRNWKNTPVRFARKNPYTYSRQAPVRANTYASPARAYTTPQRFVQNRYAHNSQRPAWRQYKQAQQRFTPRRYVIPAAAPVRARAPGYQAAKTPVRWGANPYVRNQAAKVQPRTPRSFRTAYDFYRR